MVGAQREADRFALIDDGLPRKSQPDARRDEHENESKTGQSVNASTDRGFYSRDNPGWSILTGPEPPGLHIDISPGQEGEP